MKFLAFALVVVAALAVADANPGGLTGWPLLQPAIVPQTIVSAGPQIIGHGPLLAPAPITTIIKSGPGLGWGPGLKGLNGGVLATPLWG